MTFAGAVLMPYTCSKCGTPHERFTSQCTCGAFNSIRKLGGASGAFTNGYAQPTGPLVLNTATSEVPPEIPRLQSGHAIMDHVLGGGLVIGSQILVAGESAVGKSTLFLEFLRDIVRNLNLRGVYISSEQNAKILFGEARRRFGIHEEKMSIAETTHVDEALRIASGFDVAVFDSIQGFNALPEHFPRPTTRIFISRINKEGSITGVTDIEHAVDVVIFSVHDDDLADEVRSIKSTKNRYGKTGKTTEKHYQIEEHGIIEWFAPRPEPKKRRKKKDEDES